jgi:hypothetical protein
MKTRLGLLSASVLILSASILLPPSAEAQRSGRSGGGGGRTSGGGRRHKADRARTRGTCQQLRQREATLANRARQSI